MFTYIYIIFLVFALSYSVSRNVLMHRKEKPVPYSFKRKENPMLFVIDIVTILLIIIGGYFFISDNELDILSTIYFILAPIFIIQTASLNYLTYKKTRDKKIIFRTIMYILMVIILMIVIVKSIKAN